jgi:excisionase family DNA binding protein
MKTMEASKGINSRLERSGKRLLSVEEAAFYLSISPRTLYSAVAPKSKKPFPVKPKRIGKLVRFDIRDLDRYVDALDSVSNVESLTD